MSDQSNQVPQSVLTPDELRQAFLDQLSVEQKIIQELDDEELEVIAGGASVGMVVVEGLEHSPSVSSHASVEGGAPALHTPTKGIPKAWQAASAGISAGGVGSFVVGLSAGKIGV